MGFQKKNKNSASRPDWEPIGEDQTIALLRKWFRNVADLICALKESPGRITETREVYIRYNRDN